MVDSWHGVQQNAADTDKAIHRNSLYCLELYRWQKLHNHDSNNYDLIVAPLNWVYGIQPHVADIQGKAIHRNNCLELYGWQKMHNYARNNYGLIVVPLNWVDGVQQLVQVT